MLNLPVFFSADNRVVKRGCITIGAVSDCMDVTVKEIKYWTCLCTTDYCNGATRGVLSNYVMFIAAGLALAVQLAVGQRR
jgi:hypothetical protein